ncbi:transglutaminase domain-containing protein, partial [Candidatus Dojkabacteria bacterium]|nr:transglutaminase domain-containing protein [Candidatus Dojkabacteria bacterium]
YRADIKDDSKFKPYTTPDKYWESDSPLIQELATKLEKNPSTLQQLIKADYNYIIDNFDYSEEKSIGQNTRYGALAAFKGAECVCMEYSDAMIALLRAQGIPARAAIGYGNDPTGIENEIGTNTPLEQKIGHQWLQVWVPEYGWMSVDPTWGETGRTYIGGNLDHLLWYTVGQTSTERASTELNTADPVDDGNLSGYDVYLQALSAADYPGETSLQSLDDVIKDFTGKKTTSTELFLKTTRFGKAIIITTPVVLVFVALWVLIALPLQWIKKANRSATS